MAVVGTRKLSPISSKRLAKLGSQIEKKNFPLSIRLIETDECFSLKNITPLITIHELKSYLEYATGIPIFMQKLHYLDEGDLQDNTDIRSNDIVPGGCLHLTVWHTWARLIQATVSGNVDEVFTLGITADSDFRTPNSEYMSTKTRQAWLQERAFVALYIASHRGHEKLVKKLVESGANINGTTSLGRTPLHVAASQDRGDIVDILLNNGADVNALDNYEESALDVAERFGHKDGARHLFLFQWQVRAANAKKGPSVPLFMHQLCDTAFPVWQNGMKGQLYYAQILPPGEFSGTSLGAKRRHQMSPVERMEPVQEEDARSIKSGLTQIAALAEKTATDSKDKKVAFQEWLKQKKKIEQVRLDQIKAEEDLKKLEEAKKKEQSLIDKESYDTWIKKQQEEKVSQEKKKAAKKLQQQQQQQQQTVTQARIKVAAVVAPTQAAALSWEQEAIDANRELQELKRFIEKRSKATNELSPVAGHMALKVDGEVTAAADGSKVAGKKKHKG